MNKNIMIGLTVLVLLLIGGAVFMMNRSTSSPISPQSPKSPLSPESTQTTQSTSLKNLMATTDKQQCTFSDAESGSSGTMYIGEGKMRGDFSSQIDNKTTTSHMISEGEAAYVWMDDQKSGFKVSLKSMEGLNAQVNTNAPQAVDINKQIDYKCSSWSIDASVFAVPTNIEFQDMSAMMKNAGKMMETKEAGVSGTMPDKQTMCAACDQAPEEAKAQCKAALNCN